MVLDYAQKEIEMRNLLYDNNGCEPMEARRIAEIKKLHGVLNNENTEMIDILEVIKRQKTVLLCKINKIKKTLTAV